MDIAQMRLVDLSVPIYHEMPIWSAEPKTGVLEYARSAARRVTARS